MEEENIPNPFVGFALDALPYTCEKYTAEKVSILIEICYRAELPPLETFALVGLFLPLTDEEIEKENELIQRNMRALFMINPQAKTEFENFCKMLNDNSD